jgi:hypothetical protein
VFNRSIPEIPTTLSALTRSHELGTDGTAREGHKAELSTVYIVCVTQGEGREEYQAVKKEATDYKKKRRSPSLAAPTFSLPFSKYHITPADIRCRLVVTNYLLLLIFLTSIELIEPPCLSMALPTAARFFLFLALISSITLCKCARSLGHTLK